MAAAAQEDADGDEAAAIDPRVAEAVVLRSAYPGLAEMCPELEAAAAAMESGEVRAGLRRAR
jgi:hypothetical protein